MRSPEARELLDEVLKRARKVADTGSGVPELAEAVREYDYFCFSEHRSTSVEVRPGSSSTGGFVTAITTKAKHFKLPLGLENS